MTTADTGAGRSGLSPSGPSSWVDAVGAAVREDMEALLDRVAGPREISARLVETPAPAPDHDLDDVSLPAPPDEALDEDPGFGDGVTADEPSASADGGGGEDGTADEDAGEVASEEAAPDEPWALDASGPVSHDEVDGHDTHDTHDGTDDADDTDRPGHDPATTDDHLG